MIISIIKRIEYLALASLPVIELFRVSLQVRRGGRDSEPQQRHRNVKKDW
jgi:hypothetical protein